MKTILKNILLILGIILSLTIQSSATPTTIQSSYGVLANNGAAVSDATVTLSDPGVSASGISNSTGIVTIQVNPTGSISGTVSGTFRRAKLDVVANPTTIAAGKSTSVTFIVTRYGARVSGAKVTLSGPGVSASGISNSIGIVTIPVKPTGTGAITATATKTGFNSRTATVTVTAPTLTYQSITTGNPIYDKYDNLIITYSTKYNMPDPMIIKAQIYQESNFDDMGVNPENACGVSTINGKPIDKSYKGVNNMVNPAWSLGSMQESRSCVNSFLTDANGNFNKTLWFDSNYKFDFYLNDWMNNANGPGNPSFNNFKQRFPSCNGGKLILMTVALWNNGNDYSSCNDPINNLNHYTSDVLSHYYELAKMANYTPLYDYNTIVK